MEKNIVILEGIQETLAALDAFDKDAVKRFDKVIDEGVASVKRVSQNSIDSNPPMSGWRQTVPRNPRATTRGGMGWPPWEAGTIRQGIRSSRAPGRVSFNYTTSVGRVINKSASGVIFELAGVKWTSNSDNTAGDQFQRILRDRSGHKAPRLVRRVRDELRPEIQARVIAALEEAKSTLQRNLNKQRD